MFKEDNKLYNGWTSYGVPRLSLCKGISHNLVCLFHSLPQINNNNYPKVMII